MKKKAFLLLEIVIALSILTMILFYVFELDIQNYHMNKEFNERVEELNNIINSAEDLVLRKDVSIENISYKFNIESELTRFLGLRKGNLQNNLKVYQLKTKRYNIIGSDV